MSAGRVGCDEMEALAPELALGTLTGAERADAVGHLAVVRRLPAASLRAGADRRLAAAPGTRRGPDRRVRSARALA